MLKNVLLCVAIATTTTGCLAVASQQSAATVSPDALQYRAVLNRYCVTCHNEKLRTANLSLEKTELENPNASAEVWEKVVRKLRTAAMPPVGAPRPDKLTYDSFAGYLERVLDQTAAIKPNPGRPAPIHRLNRAEYTNAVRDLVGIEIDSESMLPPDSASYGFDNIGEILSVTPLLLERYMTAARKIARLAVGSPMAHPDFKEYEISATVIQEDRMSDDLPFGSRGGISIRHFFPMDGEYVIKVSLQENLGAGGIIGINEPHRLDIRLDGARLKLFAVGGKPKKSSDEFQPDEDLGLEVRLAVKSGARQVGVTFVNEISDQEGVLRGRLSTNLPAVKKVSIAGPYDAKGPGDTLSRRKILVCSPAVPVKEENPGRLVSLKAGIGNTANGNEACARQIISMLARRAYRRPVAEEDLEPLLKSYQAGLTNGGFETGIETALRGILVSPAFLFRIERNPEDGAPDTPYRISDLDLASRLSFFLWSSIPDDELLGLAARGMLKDPAVLEQQVKRMLADPRAKALVTNFAGQWLLMRNVRVVSPDPGEFPDFDANLRQAFQRETELFFENNLREDHSALELLDADYTFVNERLARHYGIPNVYGNEFRRVKLTDENRKGLLGKASILTVTSYASRTSPVLRGKWLLENILGAPPPPPPPNVPSLQERNEEGKILSMRQQMEQHRANPACSVCHARMDPLGFALENFDAVGKWRTTSGAYDTAVDSSGVLPDGTKFNGPAELRKVLLSHPEQFVSTVTEKLLTYALGRGVEYYDEPAVRKILREASAGNYRWSSLILGVVRSTPFQMRSR